jgi:hypothetical protein
MFSSRSAPQAQASEDEDEGEDDEDEANPFADRNALAKGE